jgi:hypothetical protein
MGDKLHTFLHYTALKCHFRDLNGIDTSKFLKCKRNIHHTVATKRSRMDSHIYEGYRGSWIRTPSRGYFCSCMASITVLRAYASKLTNIFKDVLYSVEITSEACPIL